MRGRGGARDREVARFVSEAAIFEHVLGVVVAPGGGLDAEVGEHCVRLPATEELDGELVDISAEEGRGAAGAEAARTDPVSTQQVSRFDESGFEDGGDNSFRWCVGSR